MAKIYSIPDIKPPVLDYKNLAKSKEDEKQYIQHVINYCKATTNDKSEYVGKMVKIAHADGYACYIVLSIKPVELIHLEIGDAWDSPYADLLTAKRIKQMFDFNENLNKLFNKN